MQQGNFDQAKQYLDMALVLDPDYYEANIHLCTYYLFKKDYPTALQVCDHLIALSPDSPELYTTGGVLNEKVGRPERATERYQRGLELYDKRLGEKKPAEEGDQISRAFLLRLMGREQEAKTELDRLVKAHEEDPRLKELASMSKEEYIAAMLKVGP